jgi:tRNA threonylcarbamoyl adenosine modification protein YeaZ
MLILAIDTTGDHGGAAIFRGEECLARADNAGRTDYAVVLFQLVEKLLDQTRTRLSDMEVFAVASGPGSFTGIRVGVAAAQGWSQAFGRPVCGVSILRAMAQQAQCGADWVVPVLDARRGEFYVSLLQRSPSGADSEYTSGDNGAGWVLKPGQLAEMLERRISAGQTVTCVVREHEPTAAMLQASLPGNFRRQILSGSLLAAIAGIALVAHADGKLQSPAELNALYIRRPDAEFNWKE